MANYTLRELEDALGVLADGGSVEKLRDRLARLNAFHSRRGMNDLHSLAERVFALSSGLRRDMPTTRAFQALWMEYIGHRLNEDIGRKLDDLADGVNAHLHEDGSVKDGEQEALEKAIETYEDRLARRVGGMAARLDTIQKAVPAVATFLRSRPVLDVPIEAVEDEGEPHVHGEHCDHDHDHHHDHGAEASEAAGNTGRKAKPKSAGKG